MNHLRFTPTSCSKPIAWTMQRPLVKSTAVCSLTSWFSRQARDFERAVGCVYMTGARARIGGRGTSTGTFQILIFPSLCSITAFHRVSNCCFRPTLMQTCGKQSIGFLPGCRRPPPEEQFELFWFSIETIARSARNKTKVPDRCAMCQEPLYCPNCQKISTHRPYPSQTIRQLFARHVSNDADRMYRITSSMRHALLHGDRVSRVEAEFDLTLSGLVDIVGKIAWVALLTNLVSTVGEEGTVRMGFYPTEHVSPPSVGDQNTRWVQEPRWPSAGLRGYTQHQCRSNRHGSAG